MKHIKLSHYHHHLKCETEPVISQCSHTEAEKVFLANRKTSETLLKSDICTQSLQEKGYWHGDARLTCDC